MNDYSSAFGSRDAKGRAYGRPPGHTNEDMVRVGSGTPGGELLRRYWQPIALSEDAGRLPKEIKILGETLILFRNGEGTPGLVYPRCMHRGTNLLYGRVEAQGIRCCYHGWLFAPDGKLLEMACEPAAKPPGKVRQPWYPLVEAHGLIFAYMGPPDRQPPFPVFALAENLGDEYAVAVRTSKKPIPDRRNIMSVFGGHQDYSWWNFYDNFLDPYHLYWVHAKISGIQFTDTYAILPKRVDYERTHLGVRSTQYRDLGNGRIHVRMGETIMPNISVITPLDDSVGYGGVGYGALTWTVPVDDTNFFTMSLMRIKPGRDSAAMNKGMGIFTDWGPDKNTDDWTLEDHQTWQSDYVCQKGQGDLSLHSEEHLSRTDRGLVLNRRMWLEQCKIVGNGGNPVGVNLQTPQRLAPTSANFILNADTQECIEGPDTRSLVTGAPA